MLAYPSHLPSWLSNWIERWLLTNHPGHSAAQLGPLAGDGSTRSFFRLRWKTASGPLSSSILVVDPSWVFSKDYPAHQAYLQQCGVAVPRFEKVDPGIGIIVMEDLGDELLQKRILAQPSEKMAWLRRTVEFLVQMQGRTHPILDDLPVTRRRFDTQKYLDEFTFTEQHLSEGLLKLRPGSHERRHAARAFCQTIESIGPSVFVHRDFHTRNLLVFRDTLSIIDFQDARMGPPHYDLASLLYDPYMPLTNEEKAALLRHYQKVMVFPRLIGELDWETFPEELEAVAFQRVVKAAGSFASFYTRYGKTTHLAYLEPALQSALALQTRLSAPYRASALTFPINDWLTKWKVLKSTFGLE